MSMDIKSLIMVAIVNLVFVCLGFYLGRMTADKASAPSMPRIFPEKPVEEETDPYFEAMYGEGETSKPTIEDNKA